MTTPQIDAIPSEAVEREQMERANNAEELLRNPLLIEAFDTLRAKFTEQLFAAEVRDVEGREKLWLMCKCLNAVEGHLKAVVTTGQMAMQERERRLSMRQRLANWITD